MTFPSSYPNPAFHGWNLTDAEIQRPRIYFRFMRLMLRGIIPAVFKVRVFNRCYEPKSGGAVYISNHQSFLDPILMSFALRRPMNYMARDTLFHMPGFKQLISSVNAFPVKRGTADTGALKEAMRRLKAGGQVVLFAEGTRTVDGRLGEFLPGVAMLAQRAAEWTVPVLIDGAYEAWPRTQLLPSPGHIVVQYAPPIHRDQIKGLSPLEVVTMVRRQLIDVQREVRRRIGRSELKYND